MTHFTSISIIYNPNSTGPGHKLAQGLKTDLKLLLPKQTIQLVKTKHAGHAEQLAYKLAKATKHPLVISASGDGGYHEVINGLLRAQSEGATPVAGLLPAGNANDHFHDVHGPDVAKAIATNRLQNIDILELHATVGSKPFTRFAHSYIGFGLTPKIGAELNKVNLNWYREIGIVTKGLVALRPVKIVRGGKTYRYDSLILSNVRKMSKILTLSKNAAVDDGKFEVTIFKKRSRAWLLRNLVLASTTGLNKARQVEHYEFKTLHALSVQLDGEIFKINKNSDVSIQISQQKLRCII